MSIYTDNGYESREDYLNCLAWENDVPISAVRELANLLGENEDFDGLVTTLEDNADQMRDWPSWYCGDHAAQ